MLCFMPIGDWQQLRGLQRKTHGIYMPPYAYCYIWSWNGSQRLRQPTQGQNEHEELVPISVDSPSDAALCFVFLLTQTREKEHTWVTTFAESEGERISNHCSVRCRLVQPTSHRWVIRNSFSFAFCKRRCLLTNDSRIGPAIEQQKHLK